MTCIQAESGGLHSSGALYCTPRGSDMLPCGRCGSFMARSLYFQPLAVCFINTVDFRLKTAIGACHIQALRDCMFYSLATHSAVLSTPARA